MCISKCLPKAMEAWNARNRALLFGILLFASLPATLASAQAARLLPPDDVPPPPPGALADPGTRSWGPEQATGKPNTHQAGDISTAWASASQDEQMEWLELEYEAAISPTQIVVHETYNPGAVVRIVTYTETGMMYELWAGKDPVEVKDGWGIAKIPVEPVMPVKKIRLYLDSENVAGWNEIDAVGIKDGDDEVHWAVKATASSTYADVGGGGIVIERRGLGGGIFE